MRRLKNTPKPYDVRSGHVLVLMAAALVVMLLMCALAIDVGYIKSTEARMQNGADAAAIAAALELAVQLNDGASESAARDAALAEGLDIAALNWAPCRCEMLFGTYEDGQFVEQDVETPATAVKATMIRDGAAPGSQLALFFAPVMGLDAVCVDAPAVSQIAAGIRTLRMGLGPFAVWEGDVVEPGEEMTIYWPDLIEPGCFGLLNLDGGSLDTGELNDWILNGYEGEMDIDPEEGLLIEGTTGWRAAIKDSLEQRIGCTIFGCVYDWVSGEGSNATFHITSFLPIRLDYVQMTGGDRYVVGTVQEMVNVPDGETGGTGDNLVKVQLVM